MSPKVTQALINSLAGATPLSGHVALASGAERWFGATTAPAEYVLGTSTSSPACTWGISPGDLALLQGGTALSSGGWRDSAGGTWHLSVSGSTVVAEVGGPPDPG